MDKDRRRADKTGWARGDGTLDQLGRVSEWQWSQGLEAMLQEKEWEKALSLSNCLKEHRKNMAAWADTGNVSMVMVSLGSPLHINIEQSVTVAGLG